MFDGWTKPKFYAKCKSALRHTRTRLEPIMKKRSAVEKFLKKDIADLLKGNLDYNAYLRADMLLVEQNMTACYNIIEQFCGHILNHLSVMQNERECPLECREAASSLAYAAARFADLPDLRQLRTLFTDRYGNSLESFASKEFVKKLKAEPPTKDMKLGLLYDIAREFSLDWDPKALEQKLFTLPPPQQAIHNNDINRHSEVIDETRRDRTSSSSTSTSTIPDYDDDDDDADSVNKPRQEARSVRRRKPLRDNNVGAEQTCDSDDERDEEERVLDGLLMHYSSKKSTYDEGKIRAALEENGRRPRTAKSMPVSELESSAGKDKKAHARSSTIELGGHVHPRLPDYDELAARVAALSETH